MIHEAIRRKSIVLANEAIKLHASINEVDSFNRTPLHKAVIYKNIDIVKLLIDNGADIDALDKNGESALFKAVKSGVIDLVETLVAAGANLNSDKGLKYTPWYAAINNAKMADKLISTNGAIRTQLSSDEEKIIDSLIYSNDNNEINLSVLNSKELIHGYVSQYNWDDGAEPLIEIVKNPCCSAATALLIYDLAEVECYDQFESESDVSPCDVGWYKLIKIIESRFTETVSA
ncbi:Ribulose-5-phosphate 4-epimerase and related epimerases and aldolases [Plesiomonas shigelloides]|uniref:DUF4274 domain-containing protein n=1 Tax=Plesiomonas shigelloides TaxID=703 RepID=UPI000D8A9AD1|nr:DUF4274 domain-containing protein [Plesiomonas shigelloides]SPZ37419.1 Ribulose-5-phosphate 4-epimerase and related epimerases and aldolases [Plesiomonas shigelloides]